MKNKTKKKNLSMHEPDIVKEKKKLIDHILNLKELHTMKYINHQVGDRYVLILSISAINAFIQ